MTHCDRLLSVLDDRKWHDHLSLYRLGMIVHSRVADLRARGCTIEMRRKDDLYWYRLQATPAALGAVSTIGPSDVPSSAPVAASCDGVSGGHGPEHNSAPAGARTPSVPSRGAQALTRRVSGAEQLVLTSSGHVNAHSEGARVDVAEEVTA